MKLFLSNKSAAAGLVMLVLIVLAALLADGLAPHDPWQTVGRPLSPPGTAYLLGSDTLGRDTLSGILHGARVSLEIGILAAIVSVCIGVAVGLVAGYFGGRVDDLAMGLTEIVQTIPSFVLMVVLVAIFQPSITSIIVAIAVVSWPPLARLVRGEVLSLRTREFVEAARLSGLGNLPIMLREILPNCASHIIVMGSLMVANAILLESALSFLGLSDPNVITWGYMIGSSRAMLHLAWWTCVFPGLAIFITVLAINLVGEGINDVFNPKLAGRRG
ncbi:ABC transporter permease [Pseudogemmobacter humi]|uniref:Glutathione transport system permease protein GsiD n=1 Tax=Pseudogemmobacter humi TaxID=2483812 RepID=A0A3P5WLF1_9RHOB|nr:ABC transporter permease [Pseudogemmobacter humi]VDC22365.1 Glutathione transport system permease protein GsiD [Pseudogemmobacter humi]